MILEQELTDFFIACLMILGISSLLTIFVVDWVINLKGN